MLCFISAVLLLVMASSCNSQITSAANTSNLLSLSTSQVKKTDADLSSYQKQKTTTSEGYRAVCAAGTAYLAVGTGGRIDRIKPDKTVTRLPSGTKVSLNDVSSLNGTDVAVGDGGVILFAKKGGNFKPAKSGTNKSLYCVTAFGGTFWASGAGGILLRSADGEGWTPVKSGTKNTILSIAGNERMCMAVTAESQILMTADGQKWDVMDYNEVYKGYSEPCRFRSIRACGDVFFIAGEYQQRPGAPAVLSSDTGEVWQEHLFSRINDKLPEEFFPLTANAIAVDWDQLVAVCNGGKLLTLTDCNVCNKLDVLCDKNINDLVSADGVLVLVGEGFWFDIRKSNAFRQYSISPEQAIYYYRNGACIVDVRTEEEYAQKHIKGCLHIPLDKVETELEKKIPDKSKEVIFYCAKGARAQKALEKALLMGYRKVYNFGGIDEWPYDTEAGNIYGGN